MKNKKAVSGIVATVIMIALVMAVAGVVWVVVTNLVSEQLEDVGSCLDVIGKVSLEQRYTCYNSSSKITQFSITIGDINVSKVVVAISGAGATKSYEIAREPTTIPGLTDYYGNSEIKLPNKNEGLTYRSSDFDSKPDSIKLYPVVNKKQCDATDTITELSSCLLL